MQCWNELHIYLQMLSNCSKCVKMKNIFWMQGSCLMIVVPAWQGEWVRSWFLWLQDGTCSACLLSNTCFFFLYHRAMGKKECVQERWEKFEVYARHVVWFSIALELGLTSSRIDNKLAETEMLNQLVLFVLSFEGIWSTRGELRLRIMLTLLVCHTAWSSTMVQCDSCSSIAATVFLSLSVHTLVNTHAHSLC